MKTRIAEYLGVTRPTLEAGFVKNERGGAMPACQTCGALVAYETQTLHREWHAAASSRS